MFTSHTTHTHITFCCLVMFTSHSTHTYITFSLHKIKAQLTHILNGHPNSNHMSTCQTLKLSRLTYIQDDIVEVSSVAFDPISMTKLLTNTEIYFITGFCISPVYSQVLGRKLSTSQRWHLCKPWHYQIKVTLPLPVLLHKVDSLPNSHYYPIIGSWSDN